MTIQAPAPERLLTLPFGALFAAALAFFTAGGIVLPAATRFADGPLGADAVGVGIGLGVFSIAALAMRPVVGWAADRFGRRPLLLGGGALTVVALAAHLIADSLAAFIVVRSVLGIGEAFFFVAAVAAISDIAPPARRGEAINLGSLSVYLGLAAGPFIGETVLAAAGFDAVWLVAGAIAGIATALSFLVPETAPAVLAAAARAAAGGDGARFRGGHVKRVPRPLVRSRTRHPWAGRRREWVPGDVPRVSRRRRDRDGRDRGSSLIAHEGVAGGFLRPASRSMTFAIA